MAGARERDMMRRRKAQQEMRRDARSVERHVYVYVLAEMFEFDKPLFISVADITLNRRYRRLSTRYTSVLRHCRSMSGDDVCLTLPSMLLRRR